MRLIVCFRKILSAALKNKRKYTQLQNERFQCFDILSVGSD